MVWRQTAFSLWLEFEEGEDDQPWDDFCNIAVKLADERRYAFNVWTFDFMRLTLDNEPVRFVMKRMG